MRSQAAPWGTSARGGGCARHCRRPASTPAAGAWESLEDPASGDRGWLLTPLACSAAAERTLADGVSAGAGALFPASWENLLRLKNLVQEHDAASTIFPTTGGTLKTRSLGVGARFTTLHWPAVQWAMAQLGLSMHANQNSIPRELVYDVEVMLNNQLDSVPFPFIGSSVPEGHQGQSVEGMSHGAVLSMLEHGFHRRRLPWGFNADHQPIGGRFDQREDALVRGCLLATFITFDLSPELAATPAPADAADARRLAQAALGEELIARVRARVRAACTSPPADEEVVIATLAQVAPAVRKMQRRDRLYAQARERDFTTDIGRSYLRELSIDELPGLTTPATLATMLALTEELGMHADYVAPAFGFQKNFPFGDDAELARRVEAAWRVCQSFGTSLGFHSGSGKSPANYQVLGRVTGGALEIKTSGRFTYEMGKALQPVRWKDLTPTARSGASGGPSPATWPSAAPSPKTKPSAPRRGSSSPTPWCARASPPEPWQSLRTGIAARALARLTPDPDHMFWFEYNFLFVLARDGKADKRALGDHSAQGYRQRSRFYQISEATRLRFAVGIASYLLMLAENTGLATSSACAAARLRLSEYASMKVDLPRRHRTSGLVQLERPDRRLTAIS